MTSSHDQCDDRQSVLYMNLITNKSGYEQFLLQTCISTSSSGHLSLLVCQQSLLSMHIACRQLSLDSKLDFSIRLLFELSFNASGVSNDLVICLKCSLMLVLLQRYLVELSVSDAILSTSELQQQQQQLLLQCRQIIHRSEEKCQSSFVDLRIWITYVEVAGAVGDAQEARKVAPDATSFFNR
jgi:hypothetical protein